MFDWGRWRDVDHLLAEPSARQQQTVRLRQDSRAIRLQQDANGRATAADPPAAAPNAGHGWRDLRRRG